MQSQLRTIERGTLATGLQGRPTRLFLLEAGRYTVPCNGDGNVIRFVRIIGHPLSVFLLVLVGLLVLYYCGKVDVNHPLYVIIALTGGWMVAFYTSQWHEKNRFINVTAYEAARTLITLSSAVAHMATNVKGDVGSLNVKLDLRKGDTRGLWGNWGDTYTKVDSHFDEYQKLHLSFLVTFEENELLFMDFRPHVNILSRQHDQLSKAYYDFRGALHALMLLHPEVPTQDEHTSTIRQQMDALSDQCMDVACMYFDMRICLLNATLGKVTKRQIPERRPQNPQFQTLSELAKGALDESRKGDTPSFRSSIQNPL